MKELIILQVLIAFFVTFGAIAQESVIIVSGEALLETAPDQVRASLYLEQFANSYDEAVKILNKRTKSVADDLAKEGFKAEEIKTSSFNASPNYEYRDGKQIQRGFRASQHLTVVFGNDPERLTRIVKRLSTDENSPNLNISFELSKQKQASLKQQLLQNAMKQARTTAEIIAATEGKQLDGFKEVRYGVANNNMQPYLRAEAMMMKADGADFAGFQAQDISLSEKVEVIWKVK